MADFCKQCSIDNFGEDSKDLAGFTTSQITEEGGYARVLCEGCGSTLVDHTGECVLATCIKAHGDK